MAEDHQLELIKEKLGRLLSEQKKDKEPLSGEEVENVKAKLAAMAKRLSEENQFSVGQFVTWKLGLKNKLKPRLNEPAIVVNLLEEPLYDQDKNPGSPYFMEPLDMVVGVLEEEHQTFMLFYVDKRRFMPLI